MGRSLLFVAIAYLLGSLPTAYLLVRWVGRGDLRSVESGSVGALNAFRATGAGWIGWTVLMADAAKGVLAVALAGSGAGITLQAVLAMPNRAASDR